MTLADGTLVVEVLPMFDELDLLHARRQLMAGIVDLHVVIEGDQTFQGQPKPFHLQSPGAIAAGPGDVVGHLFRFPSIAEVWSPWDRERYQRDQAAEAFRAFELHQAADVLVISADLDEFVDPAAIEQIAAASDERAGRPVALGMRNIVFGEWENTEPLFHARAFRTGSARGGWWPDSLHQWHGTPCHGVEACGWHLTWLGDEERRLRKVMAFSHTECQPGNPIWEWIAKGRPMPGGTPHRRTQLDGLPEVLRELVANA